MRDLTAGEVEYILKNMTVYFESRIRTISGSTKTLIKGKSALDYAADAVMSYLAKPDRFDPKKIPFDIPPHLKVLIYLKKVVSRSYLRDAIGSAEFSAINYSFSTMPETILLIESEVDKDLDYEALFNYFMKKLINDPLAKKVFECQFGDGLKRQEIIDHLRITELEYNRANGRLGTLMNVARREFKNEKL